MINELKKEVVIESIKEDVIKYRRDLHKIPELMNTLPKTVSYVTSVLEKENIPFKYLMNKNAVVAVIDSKKEGKCIALRSDMDALPIKEETGLSFSSTNDNMHACGHDAHTATLLATAKYLNRNKDLFKGKVKLLFQPGEEHPGGAKPMILEGALENPKVDAVMGMHNGHIDTDLKFGEVGISYGPIMAAVDVFYIKLTGKGGHGAYPELCHDPIVCASEIVSSLQKIRSRELAPTDIGLLSICKFQGGVNENVIPDIVNLEGTVRTTDLKVQDKIEKRLIEITEGIAKTYNITAEVKYVRKYPATINDKDFTLNFKNSLLKVMDEDKIIELERPAMGAEDMSYFLQEVPGTFFFFDNHKAVENKFYPHHSSKFDLDDTTLPKAVLIFVTAVIDYLNNN